MSLLRSAVAAIGLLLVATPSFAADEILIRFAHVVGERTPKGEGATLFKTLVEQRLAGRVRVEVFPRSVKFNDNQVMLALLLGDVEMAAPSLAKFRTYTKKLQIFDLPFLFKDMEALHRFQASPQGRALLDSMEARGIKGLAYWDNGPRVVSANRPLRRPEDASGLTFRIEPSAVFQSQWALVGVNTFPMPFKRVYDAVREGLVKGQENAWSNIYSRKLHTLQKYFTEVSHTYLNYMVVTSDNFWNSLPPDIRTELESILAEVTAEVRKLAREKAITNRRQIVEAGRVTILTLSDGERDAWRQALMPVWKEFEAEIGRDLIDAAVASNQ